MSAAGSASQGQKRKNFNISQREEVVRHLLASSKDGVRRHGSFQEAAEKYGCHWETIKRIWRKHEERVESGDPTAYIGNERKENSGRKGLDVETLQSRLLDIPPNERTTQRRLAAALGIPTTTLHNNLKALGLRAQSNSIKPYLTPEGRKERLRWVLRWLAAVRAGPSRVLHDFDDFVHVDEKWFCLFNDGQRFYLCDGEEAPVRKAQSKRFMTKIMFLAAVARPRHNPAINSLFDGKIGLWAFTERVQAVRSSRNRAAGSMVTNNNCVEVTKETYKEKLINGVIPVIKEKWPAATRRSTIYIQQEDNAKPHRINEDEDLREACLADGFDIRLINQPPNSPDTNILDLGFFASIQSLQDRTRAKTIDDLLHEVELAWAASDSGKLGKVWTSLQACLEQILLCDGDNIYKLPHLRKDTAARRGTPIPWRYPVSEEAWLKGREALAALERQARGGCRGARGGCRRARGGFRAGRGGCGGARGGFEAARGGCCRTGRGGRRGVRNGGRVE
eukprot:jgi/Undpi1/10319/HiC_scaffold_28.g12770.m1